MKKLNFEALADFLPEIVPEPTPEPLPSLKKMSVDDLYKYDLTSMKWDDSEKRNYITIKSFKPCGRCHEGYIHIEEHNAMSPCPHCLQAERKAKRIERARLPLDATSKTFKNYEMKAEFKSLAAQVRRWSQTQNKEAGPLIYGPPGTGKSHFAYACAHQLIWSGFKVRYATHSSLLDLERASWSDKKSESPLRNLLRGINVLILDEVGGVGGGYGKVSDWVKRTTSEMLDSIYRQWSSGDLYVLMISNVQLHVFMRTYNEALQSRLREMVEPILINGEDRRNNP